MVSAMNEPLLGLLVASRDEPGVLYRLAEVIFKHRANIEYIAGGARTGEVAELQIEVSGAADEARLVADVEALQGITKVSRVPTFQRIYGKRVIVIGGGAQVGMVAQGAVSEADRHNIRGERISVDTIPLVGEEQLADAVRAVARLHRARVLVLAGALMGGDITKAVHEIRDAGIIVVCTNMAGLGAGCRRPRGQRPRGGRRDGGHAGGGYGEVLDRARAREAILNGASRTMKRNSARMAPPTMYHGHGPIRSSRLFTPGGRRRYM